jgi:uncharacterized OB-fold protein
MSATTATATPAKPLPTIDPVSKGFWDLANRGRLSVQRCDDCGHRHYPGAPVCPRCLSRQQTWEPVSGRGTLLSWVRFHRAYWEGFAPDIPYVVILVGLEEGPMMISNLVGARAEDVPIGAPLEVVFERATDQINLPKFRPRQG